MNDEQIIDKVMEIKKPVAWCLMRDGYPDSRPYYGKGPDKEFIERVNKKGFTVRYFYDSPDYESLL